MDVDYQVVGKAGIRTIWALQLSIPNIDPMVAFERFNVAISKECR